MAEYDNTNTGVLFHNDQEGNDKRPYYKGTLDVNGKEYEIAGWKRIAKSSGKAFISLKISEPFQPKQGNAKPDKVIDDIGDEPIRLEDIPFN